MARPVRSCPPRVRRAAAPFSSLWPLLVCLILCVVSPSACTTQSNVTAICTVVFNRNAQLTPATKNLFGAISTFENASFTPYNNGTYVQAPLTDGQQGLYLSVLDDAPLLSVIGATYPTPLALVTATSEGVLDTRGNSQQAYFANADPATEMLGLLAYAMSTVAPQSIGFVYVNQLQSSSSSSSSSSQTTAGSAVYAEFARRIAALNYSGPVSTYAYKEGSYSSDDFQSFVSGLSPRNAAVFLFTPAGNDANAMFADLLATSSTNTIMVPSWLIATATAQYLASSSPSVPAASVIVSSTNPHPQDTTFPVSMAQFSSDYSNSESTALNNNSAESVAAVAGWLAVRTVIASLQPYAFLKSGPTQQTYVDGLFQQRTYTIGGEIPLGTYTSDCNVGGRLVLLYSLQSMTASGSTYYGLTSTPLYTLNLKPWECHASDVALNIAQMVKGGYVQYNSAGDSGTFVSTQVRETVAQLTVGFSKGFSYDVQGLSSAAWATAMSAATANAVVGAASVGVDVTSVSQLLVDTFFMQPTLYQNYSNVAYLTATNEQQWGTVATWAAQSATVPDVRAVLRSTNPSAMQSTLSRIFGHVGITLRSTTVLAATDTLQATQLPTSGVLLMAGVILSDIGTLLSGLNKNPGLMVMLMFDDFTQWYDTILTTFSGSESAKQRLLFVTNLPRWTSQASITSPSSTTSTLSTNFLAAVAQNLKTPAAMRTYVAMRVLNTLSSEAAVPTSAGLQNALYSLRTLQVDDLPLGPFQPTGCVYNETAGAVTCSGVRNGGAGALFLWSLQETLGGTAPTAGPYVSDLFGYVLPASDDSSEMSSTSTTTTTTTTPAPKHEKSTSETTIIAAVVACVAAGIAAVIIGIVVCICCIGDSRDNRNAPKDETQPVTLMFTDIESSTALWATAPQAMAAAVALHHKMIRQLIVKYKCYEVKTIGDSFMIACTDPFAAVQLARDLQLGFHQANWGSTAIDDAYAATGKLAGGTDPDECDVCPWSGLRVRVGIHRGLAEVRLDEVTKGYDYYGDTVNTAARTESAGCGGQVLCTASVVDALADEQRASLQLVELGPHQLRGVAAPIVMHELRTVPGRVFPSKTSAAATGANPLAELPEGGAEAPLAADVDGRSEDTASETALASLKPVTEVLDVYFSPYTVQQRIKLLRKACKHFCLPAPPRRMFASDDAYLESLMSLVATRTSVVVDFRNKQQEGSQVDSTAEAPANAAAIDEMLEPAASVASARPSGVFFSGIDSPTASVMKRRRSMASVRSGERRISRDGTMVLVLDNGALLTLTQDVAETIAETSHRESQPPAVSYLNGAPTVGGGEVMPCFEEGNGLLFRLIDKDAQRWAFYNDTKEFDMHVHFSVGRKSRVEWGPGVAGRVTQAEGTGRYEGELVVPPLATEVLMTGRVNGYNMRYSATMADN